MSAAGSMAEGAALRTAERGAPELHPGIAEGARLMGWRDGFYGLDPFPVNPPYAQTYREAYAVAAFVAAVVFPLGVDGMPRYAIEEGS